MDYGCRGKTVLISGGTSGIGLAAAQSFLQDGGRVFVMGRDPKRGRAAQEESPGLYYLQGDVTSFEQCAAAAKYTAEHGNGRIDILVNSAGVYLEQSLAEWTEADYTRLMDVNVKGTLLMIRACEPYMRHAKATGEPTVEAPAGKPAVPLLPGLSGRESGADRAEGGCCIVNIASDAGIGGNYGCPVYCASKGAVVALTKALALDLAPSVRVNCVCPGDVDTPLLAEQLAAAEHRYTKEDMGRAYPLERIAAAREVAHVICSVASPANSFMTGAIIPVDGGLTARG